jgi:cytochrome c-type biogenesis protein CcmH
LRNHPSHLLSVIPAKAGIQAFRIIRSVAALSICRANFLVTPSPPPRGRGKGEGAFITGALKTLSTIITCSFLLTSPALSATPPDLEDRTREIATELRCVVCQNLSVADSPSEMAQQMRAVVREQLEAGKTPDQIKDFFVSKYGEWVLLKPKTTGFSAILWILPYVALVLGIIAALWFVRRASKSKRGPSGEAQPSTQAQTDFLAQSFDPPDIEDTSARARLLRERGRLKDELTELEFDFQAGKLSEADYGTLKREIEIKGTTVMQQLNVLPAEPAVKTPREKLSRAIEPRSAAGQSRFRRWQLVAGGVFLLLFGLALGVMLTQSVRPRASENDTMTGDFMTGTTPASGEARAAMTEGKQAFAQQEYPKAIDSFKKVLAAEPNNPEAHAYMGFILVQAGHGDGALMAFDKALSVAPNFPMALWGRGMVLYQDKKDYAGAREIFERLLNIVPPGEGRNEVAKVLAEIPASAGERRQATPPSPSASGPAARSAQISGKITIDPKLKAHIDPNETLYIRAPPAGGAGGPPLAVKKLDKPVFPLNYSLGQENVMMPGVPFNGKINVTVRLDKDGNPTTRGTGDMTGELKSNPIDAGASNADITIDQIVQ